MRLMLTYRDAAGAVQIADVHADLPETGGGLPLSAVPEDAQEVLSVVEVLAGVDYDKAGLARSHQQPVMMLLK